MSKPGCGLAVDGPAHSDLSSLAYAGCVISRRVVDALDAAFAARYAADRPKWERRVDLDRQAEADRVVVLAEIVRRGADGASVAQLVNSTPVGRKAVWRAANRLKVRGVVRAERREFARRPRCGPGVVEWVVYVSAEFPPPADGARTVLPPTFAPGDDSAEDGEP